MDMEIKNAPNGDVLRLLQEQHRHYSEKLESLLQKPYLSEDEKLEEVRLKKLKLRVKDEMTARQSTVAYMA